MPRHDYIFVDESGDAGYKLDPVTGELLSSNYYIAAAPSTSATMPSKT
jgi:hypothetical protein